GRDQGGEEDDEDGDRPGHGVALPAPGAATHAGRLRAAARRRPKAASAAGNPASTIPRQRRREPGSTKSEPRAPRARAARAARSSGRARDATAFRRKWSARNSGSSTRWFLNISEQPTRTSRPGAPGVAVNAGLDSEGAEAEPGKIFPWIRSGSAGSGKSPTN